MRKFAERQAFLLKLSDALRPLGDPLEVQTAALRVLGEYLAVNRAFYNEIDEERDAYVIHRTYANGVAPLTGHFRLSVLRQTAELAGSGQIVVLDDVNADPRLSEFERASYATMEVAAGVGVPLIKDGRWVAGLGVHHATPRHWTPQDIELIHEVAERTWEAVERARAVTAQRESDERFHALFDSTQEGFMEVEVVQDADGKVIDLRYVVLNPAFERMTGLKDVTGLLVSEFMPDLEPEWAERYTQVVNTGEAIRFELPAAALGRWFNVYIARIGGAGSRRVAAVYNDVTERKRAEFALRESDERQAFLLKFSDAVRPLTEPLDVQTVAVRVLGEHLGAVRAQYWEVEPDGEHVRSEGGYAKSAPPISGRVQLNDYGVHVIEAFAAGLTVAVSDVTTDPLASQEVLAAYDAVGVRAYITVPLVKGGRLVALLAVSLATARDWTSQEIALAEETAERTWAAVEQARAEAALVESETKYRTLFENMHEGFLVLERVAGDPLDYRILAVNPAYEHHTGLHDSVGRTLREIAPTAEEPFEAYRLVEETGSIQILVTYIREIDRWFEVEASSAERPGQVLVLFRDVTERKRAEMALRESVERQAFLLKLSDALRPLADPDEIQFAATRLLGERLGVTRVFYFNVEPDGDSFVLRRDYVDGVPSVAGRFSISQFDSHLAERWRSGITVHSQDVHSQDVPPDQRYSPEQLAAFDATQARAWLGVPLAKADRLVAVLGISHAEPRAWMTSEITLAEEVAERTWAAVEQARAEEALRESEARLRDLNADLERQVIERTQARGVSWQVSPDLMGALNSQGYFETSNPAWQIMLGWSEDEIARTPIWELLHPDDVERTRAGFALAQIGQPAIQFPNRYRCKDGGYRWISWVGVPENGLVYCTGRDITAERIREAELEEAREALRQSQKMEAMGQLTGGVAHDFNNLLTPIVGALDMLQRRGVGGEREQRWIAGAVQSAERARILVQRLLAFARRQPLQPTAVDVGKLISGMADLVASTTGPQIKVAVDVTPHLPAANADMNQLEMALLNLTVNARDAMPDGGTLRISARQETVRDGQFSEIKAGNYIKLSVADTGTGMDEATLARAVEPFFSTKGIGRGTGLGLSMVHGLASQLGGCVRIASQPGLGTNIDLFLPQSALSTGSTETVIAEKATSAVRGTALLVDDEELIRMSTTDMLESLGYRVVEASSGEEALRLIENGLSPDLLITDHLMPGINGAELARELRARSPGLPVLIVSGYAEGEGISPDLPRLPKPFRQDELAASLLNLGKLP